MIKKKKKKKLKTKQKQTTKAKAKTNKKLARIYDTLAHLLYTA